MNTLIIYKDHFQRPVFLRYLIELFTKFHIELDWNLRDSKTSHFTQHFIAPSRQVFLLRINNENHEKWFQWALKIPGALNFSHFKLHSFFELWKHWGLRLGNVSRESFFKSFLYHRKIWRGFYSIFCKLQALKQLLLSFYLRNTILLGRLVTTYAS